MLTSTAELEKLVDIYCSDCCLLCEECGLKDFIRELPYLIEQEEVNRGMQEVK